MGKTNFKNIFIPKTILFLLIMIFMSFFSSIFGSDNSIIGVATVISLLILLGKNLTKKPFKNFSILLGINITLGICSFIAYNHIGLGIIITFLVLAIIGYYFSFNLTKGLVLPYGLMYIIILNTPVDSSSFALRLLSLVFGAISIMVSQFIVNRKNNNTYKKGDSLIECNSDEDDSVYKEVNIFGQKIKVHTISASYAIRIGILASITSFIVFYFNLEHGRWMVYTIFSLTELYSENCIIRSKKRIEGTIIGALVVILLFLFIKDPNIRILIVMFAGYLNSFVIDYRNIMILATISAITPLSITNGSIEIAFQRIMYVAIGTALALLANKFILSQSKDSNSLKECIN